MGVFAGTERQCTEDEHDDENDSQISEFGLNHHNNELIPRFYAESPYHHAAAW